MTPIDQLCDMLRSYRFPMGNEYRLQSAIEQALKENNFAFEREKRFGGRDRLDFLVGNLALECKADGSPSQVLSQLLRYAEHPEITGIVLVSSRSTHRFSVETLGDKPFRVILTGAIL